MDPRVVRRTLHVPYVRRVVDLSVTLRRLPQNPRPLFLHNQSKVPRRLLGWVGTHFSVYYLGWVGVRSGPVFSH